MSRWVASLNEDQKVAALHNYGPMLILAGAGSGKTTTLVARTGRLIDERIANAENICVLTFTNKAARELKHRVSQKLPHAQKLWTGTFHSFGVRTLRSYYKQLELPKFFGIMDQGDSSGLIREILKDFNLYKKDKFDTDVLLAQMSRWREKGQVEAQSDQEYDIVTQWLLPKYERKKQALGVVDFDDLILKVVELYQNNPSILQKDQNVFHQIMVDEFQDTNVGQMKLIDLLASSHNNLSVVGDDDQSIYGWRGAQVQNILNFPKKYLNAKVIRLEKNYRSTSPILDFANASIVQNKNRYDKVLVNPQQNPGQIPEVFVYDQDTDEIDGILREISTFKEKGFKNKDIAILYRANSQGGLIETALRQKGLPYKLSGGTSFLERKEVKDILSYLKCAFRPNDIDFRRIFNTPSRGLGETTIEKLVEVAKHNNSTFYRTSLNWNHLEISPKAGQTINQLHEFLNNLKISLLSSADLPSVVLIQKMEEVGYKRWIQEVSKDALMASKRWNLVEVFARSLDRFIEKRGKSLDSFNDYLLSLELKDDEEEDHNKDEIQLLTLHACKGLEFPCVFLMGIEEDILPHKRLGSDISEERRLFYVGVTRAQKHLVLTLCRKRQIHGKWAPRLPSRFVEEVPKHLYVKHEQGFRPISPTERKKMLSDLMNKLST